jgi:hypothetical protein
LLLGTFFPLILVVGLALLVAIAVLVREITLLLGASRATNSKNLALSKEESLSLKTHSGYKPYQQDTPEKEQPANDDEVNKVETLERESDAEWLAEIASKLDPASPEDIELLNTAKTMLRHANNAMGHLSRPPDSLKYAQGHQQKELSKQFIERKLVESKSTK